MRFVEYTVTTEAHSSLTTIKIDMAEVSFWKPSTQHLKGLVHHYESPLSISIQHFSMPFNMMIQIAILEISVISFSFS